ncbi:DUF5060 domain-containing protein [Luteolibacter soli]|uniref:DUF5060 domain-containing protein n=1 Tax=Luteolibacter soli TaxID=3135280 RepID=A0ABU9AXQ1_9BACT
MPGINTALRSMMVLALVAGAWSERLVAEPPAMAGELKQWHKVTLNFTGPETSEAAVPNPFTDYRLDVTFRHVASGRSYVVPGYYAADGDAGNTSATAGHVWRVHFAPDATGEWTYTVSFRTGVNVMADASAAAGTSAGYFDAQSGGFLIQPTDKTGRDMRAKGRLEYVGKHHLRYAGTGRYFMKAGVDSPENLLSYADFDGSFKTDGHDDFRVKTWAPHVADWQTGDPEWQDHKGHGLIGAINYLASEGINSFSFLTMNIDGDDKNVFPYPDYAERLRIDVSRMDQWGMVFDHGTKMGMHLHFKTQETENELMLDGGDLGVQRKLYYRELIARFGHNLALNWNLGEEINNATLAQKVAWAQYFYDTDPYHHPIVIHNGASHFDMMGNASKLTGFSLQLNNSDFSDTFAQSKRYITRSADFGRPWVVAADEPGDSRLSVRPDNDAGTSHRDARKNALWGNIMAGGAGCEFYFGYDKPEGDLTLQNFRSRDAFWDYCRYTVNFFAGNNFPFEEMKNQNALVSGNGDNANRCLGKIGSCYLVQLHDGGSATLDLTGVTGNFTTKWFNPRTGVPLIDGVLLQGGGIVPLGTPPDTPTEDWVVLVQSTDGSGGATNAAPVVDAGPDKAAYIGDAAPVAVTLNGSVTDDGLPDEFSLVRAWSVVSGPAAVSFSNVNATVTSATFTQAGTYVLSLEASDGDLSGRDWVQVTVLPIDEGSDVPVFLGLAISTSVNRPAIIPHAEILATGYDPDGDPIVLTVEDGGTAAGGEVTAEAGHLLYTPAIDYSGPDSFLMTILNDHGVSASAYLDINVVPSDGIGGVQPTVERAVDGAVRIRFAGIPGYAYAIQRSVDLVTWTTVADLREENGVLDFTDIEPPEGRAFYRVAVP